MKVESLRPVNIICHRGSIYEYPENLILSHEAAFRLGFDTETDLQKVKDEHVLYHDDFVPGPNDNESMARGFLTNGGGFYFPSGRKPVTECTIDELLLKAQFNRAKLEAFLSHQAGEQIRLKPGEKEVLQIATFDDLIQLVKRYPDRKVYLELKRADDLTAYDDGMEEEVAGIISDNGLLDRFVIVCSNHHVLKNMRKANSAVTIAADPDRPLGTDSLKHLASAIKLRDEIGLKFWEPSFNETTQELLNAILTSGLELVPWVTNENKSEEIEQLKRLKNVGVKYLYTNQAEKAREIFAAVCGVRK